MEILVLNVKALTPIVAPILQPTKRQIEYWKLREKYGGELSHIDRFFWRTSFLGKPQPTIMGSTIIGALNLQIPEFQQLRQKYKDKIHCLGAIFHEDDVILEKRNIHLNTSEKSTLAVYEVICPEATGALIFQVPKQLHEQIKQILIEKTILVGGLKSRGYGRLQIIK